MNDDDFLRVVNLFERFVVAQERAAEATEDIAKSWKENNEWATAQTKLAEERIRLDKEWRAENIKRADEQKEWDRRPLSEKWGLKEEKRDDTTPKD